MTRGRIPEVVALSVGAVCLGLAVAGLSGAFAVSGSTVEAGPARRAIERSGYRITWRSGRVPSGYASAMFGHATNARGASIDFALLLADPLPDRDWPRLPRLVPNQQDEASTAGHSWVWITNAGSPRHAGRRFKEEMAMSGELELHVAATAPEEFKQEGP